MFNVWLEDEERSVLVDSYDTEQEALSAVEQFAILDELDCIYGRYYEVVEEKD